MRASEENIQDAHIRTILPAAQAKAAYGLAWIGSGKRAVQEFELGRY
jgi:hypothetical protein